MPDKYYSKEEIGERIRARLRPKPLRTLPPEALQRLKEAARRGRRAR